MKTKAATIVQSMRPPFLLLPIVVVFLGFALSLNSIDSINWSMTALVLLGAISAHIGVNTLNEYQDFTSGLDYKTKRTPFSGGSGALIENPQSASGVLVTWLISLVITVTIGIFLMINLGLSLLPIGLVGLIIIVTYTKWLNRSPFLCLIAPGLGFGLLMIIGTNLVLTGTYSSLSALVSLVVFFQVNNLLLLNQFPDIEADESIGRRHFLIVHGVGKGVCVYGLFVLATCITIIGLVYAQLIPQLALLSLFPAALGFVVLWASYKYSGSIQQLIPFMGLNVFVTLSTPLILGLTLILG